MKTKSIVALAVLISCNISTYAQEVLDINACRELALQYNKEISAAAKQTEMAHYTAKSMRGNFFPNISADALGLYSTADGSLEVEGGMLPCLSVDASGNYLPTGQYAYFPGLGLDYSVGAMVNAGISIEQPIYMGGKIRSAYKIASLGEEIAEANEHLTAYNVIIATDQAYALLVRCKEMKKVAEKYNCLLQNLLQNVENAYEKGMKPQNDVLKVRVKLSESELALRKADNAIRLATMNLCHYIGRDLDADIAIVDDFPEIDVAAAAAVLDISARPEVEMLDKRTAIADQQVRLNRSEQLPQIGLKASYGYTYGLEIADEVLFNNANLAVMLNVSIPIYHFGEKQNKTRAVKAQRDQIVIERQQKNELMTLELTQARNNFDEATLECELAEGAMTQAEENLRISQKQYEAGMETLSNYLEAQALWQSAYQNKVEANFHRYIEYMNMRKASGTIDN